MTTDQLITQLSQIKEIIPQLEETNLKYLSELREELRDELKEIKIIPSLTSGGLETVATVLGYLYLAEFLIQKELKKQQQVKTGISSKPSAQPAQPHSVAKSASQAVPQSQPQPKPISKPLPPQPTPAISSVPQPRPQPKPSTPPKSNSSLDFGPYSGKNNKV